MAVWSWIKKWQVESSSNPNTFWTVSFSDNGEWGCGCPVWKYKRKICHHIIHIINNIKSGKIKVVTDSAITVRAFDTLFAQSVARLIVEGKVKL